jgi:DNA-binding MarR family transcriptional regulator
MSPRRVQPLVEEVIAVAAFRTALRRFLRRSERIARKSGLTPQRYLLLLMIKGAPAGDEQSTVGALSRRLQLGQSTVTELVARAEQAGLLKRQPSPHDRRVVYLRLSREGERRLARSFTALKTERRQLGESLADLDAEPDPHARSGLREGPDAISRLEGL